jgi:CheY-like chemotaxis protein
MTNNELIKNEPIKILIADNDDIVLTGIERALEDEGYETVTAVSCEEVAAMLSKNDFDLIVLDDYLSDGDSVQVMTECRSPEDGPLVIVTFNHSLAQDTRAQLQSLGVSAFVSKGAHPELAEIVRYLLAPQPGWPGQMRGGIT